MQPNLGSLPPDFAFILNILCIKLSPLCSLKRQQNAVFLNESGHRLRYKQDIAPIVSQWMNATECAEHHLNFAKVLAEHQWTFMFHDGGRFWTKLVVFIPFLVVLSFIVLGCSYLWKCSRPQLCCCVSVQLFALIYVVVVIGWEMVRYHDVLFEDGPYSSMLERCDWPRMEQLSPLQKLVQFLSFEFEFGALTSNVSMHYTSIPTLIPHYYPRYFLLSCCWISRRCITRLI